jgi:hypothetical protein
MARANLDLFAFLIHQTNLDKFADVLADRWNFVEFTRTAHEHQFLARIANLFTLRSDTDTFPWLMDEAERSGSIDAAACATITLCCQPVAASQYRPTLPRDWCRWSE